MTASPILLLHILSGAVGLLSGTVAIIVRKGSRSHAMTGIVFSVAMLTLGASGVLIAIAKSQTGNILGGILTVYMVATAWRAARRGNGKPSALDWLAFAVALVVGAFCVTYGWRVAQGLTMANDGVPAGMDFFLGSVMLIAAAGDVRVLAGGGIQGAPRIARHLWRMCFGLFIASGSFFLGRQQIFPEVVRRSNVLILLTVLPLLLLVFWMIRVRFTSAFRRMPQRSIKQSESLPY